MKKFKRGRAAVALVLVMSLLGGCAGQQGTLGPTQSASSETAESLQDRTQEDAAAAESGTETGAETESAGAKMETAGPETGGQQAADLGETDRLYSGIRPALLHSTEGAGTAVTPCVEVWRAEPDLGNVENLWQFYLQDGMKEKLVQNGFVVQGDAGGEFFEIYENNRYELMPNFVTVDSLMHTYHLYFAYLLKNIEKDHLSEALLQLSRRMLENSLAQYEQFAGSEWESAAKRNAAFFSVGTKLLDESTEADSRVEQIVSSELSKISQAGGIEFSEITGDEEDYSQYVPRGYYEGDEKLERYFKAMMWYGRIHFIQREEDLDRSALLITKALSEDEEALALWNGVYAVTSFFSGASDDRGVCEYAPLMEEIYGRGAAPGDLIGNDGAFAEFHERTAALEAPKINSIPIADGEDNVIPGFRFMGQRFTIDAAVMQQLIYQRVRENGQGQKRMLPDVLDVPAALGSDIALRILEEDGAADYAGYRENMSRLREGLSQENEALWSASLYAGWLNTLRPLLAEKGEGYPIFMQNEEWMKKDLECFSGSFTELKHDTILYAKQVMAEMGGGYDEEPDDRGYVEPEPLVYERFAQLSAQTAQGLSQFGMLSEKDEEMLSRLTQIAEQLLTISNKELVEEGLTEEEYEFIRCYGGHIEHFWYEVATDTAGEEIAPKEFPAAIVADIATDPNGTVLEVGTGNPSMIYVVVKVEGKIKLARGSVYSFYQFPWPLSDRLTDSKWRQMMGIQSKEDGSHEYNPPVKQPEWTQSYRYVWE